jgi:Glycerophosphoryl diester phosphodiesterase family
MNLRHPDTIPTYRENTVESFLRAAEAGATFVEFDVQVADVPSCPDRHSALVLCGCGRIGDDRGC